jgi:glutaminyl-peptide cyclotransferase
LLLAPLVALAGCAPEVDGGDTARARQAVEAVHAGLAAGVPLLRPDVLARLPHDTDAWTEGLEVAGGRLYESDGLAGRSRLRELDPATGRLLRESPLPGRLYAEGITVLGDRIWQLTYTDHVALPWDRRTLRPGTPLPYPGQGWGLCHLPDGTLLASDGSDRLRHLSGTDLHPLGEVAVHIAGRPLPALNELECLPDGTVWANVYQSDYLVRIASGDGGVLAVLDASALVPDSARQDPTGEVLNGVAALPGSDELLLTGKFWPVLYRVRPVPDRPRPVPAN